MAKRKRTVGSVATELVRKSREAMLSAVSIYNNPQVDFKSELFIVTAVISWTYLLHAYYRKAQIDYRQIDHKHVGKHKRVLKTQYGAVRHWSLEECLDCPQSPVDAVTTMNLKFLIGIRHEIEHQMTTRIDDQLSAKFMACALNFNAAIKKLFGSKYSLESLQSFQEELLLGTIRPIPTRLDPNLFLYHDGPLGEGPRMTYVRLEGSTVTALVMFVPEKYIDGVPCAGIGYAVPQDYRGQGRAKEIIRAGIADMQYGLGLQGIPAFYVEAIVGADNSASRRVAEQLISMSPEAMTDGLSGLPAFRYIRLIEKTGKG